MKYRKKSGEPDVDKAVSNVRLAKSPHLANTFIFRAACGRRQVQKIDCVSGRIPPREQSPGNAPPCTLEMHVLQGLDQLVFQQVNPPDANVLVNSLARLGGHLHIYACLPDFYTFCGAATVVWVVSSSAQRNLSCVGRKLPLGPTPEEPLFLVLATGFAN